MYAADVISRQHFPSKNIDRERVKTLLKDLTQPASVV